MMLHLTSLSRHPVAREDVRDPRVGAGVHRVQEGLRRIVRSGRLPTHLGLELSEDAG